MSSSSTRRGARSKAAGASNPNRSEAALLTAIVGQLSRSGSAQEREHRREQLETDLAAQDEIVSSLVTGHNDTLFACLDAFGRADLAVQDARQRAAQLRADLIACKRLVETDRDQLRQLWIESLEQREMLRLLDRVGMVRRAPDRIRQFVSRGRFYRASCVLMDALRALESLESIKALEEIERRLRKKHETIHITLTEEIHRLIYAKHEWFSEEDAYSFDFDRFLDLDSREVDKLEPDTMTPREQTDKEQRRPEEAILLLVKAVDTGGQLKKACRLVKQKLKSEISLLVDRTVAHVKELHQASIAQAFASISSKEETGLGPFILFSLLTHLYRRFLHVMAGHACFLHAVRACRNGPEILTSDEEEYGEVYSEQAVWCALQDEVKTLLCLHLDIPEHAVAAIQDAASMLTSHASPLVGSGVPPKLKEARAKAMAALGSVASSQFDDINVFFRPKHETPSAFHSLFKFSNSENALVDSKVNQERTLKGNARSTNVAAAAGSEFMQDDKYHSQTTTSQRLLCPATLRNIAGAYKATMQFVQEASEFLRLLDDSPELGRQRSDSSGQLSPTAQFKSSASSIPAIIDAATHESVRARIHELRLFIQGCTRLIHIPLMMEDVGRRVKLSIPDVQTRIDVLVDDAGQDVAPSITQSAWAVYQALGRLLTHSFDLPHFANDLYSTCTRLLSDYAKYCEGRYHALTWSNTPSKVQTGVGGANPNAKRILSASLAATPAVVDAIKQTAAWMRLYQSEEDVFAEDDEAPPTPTTVIQQALVILRFIGQDPPSKKDVLGDIRRIKSLALLHRSSEWLAGECDVIVEHLRADLPKLQSLWRHHQPVVSSDGNFAMAVIRDSLDPNLLKSMTNLASKLRDVARISLITLKLEVQVQCIYYLVPCIRQGPFFCEIGSVETDPHAASLNKVLLETNDAISMLSKDKQTFVFDMLDMLMAEVLVSNAKFIQRCNQFGVKRITRTIFALQQTLGHIFDARARGLDRASQYFELLQLTPEEVLESIVSGGKLCQEAQYRVALDIIARSATVPDETASDDLVAQLRRVFRDLV